MARMSRYGPKPMPEEVRFMAKVAIDLQSGCWEWTGAKAGTGYGVFRRNDPRRMMMAHRWIWEYVYGPTDLWVLHHCDNRRCIRPSHLFVGTRRDNIDDALAKRRYQHGTDHYTHRLGRQRDALGRFIANARLNGVQQGMGL